MHLILWVECPFRQASQEAGTASDWFSAAEPHGGKCVGYCYMPCVCVPHLSEADVGAQPAGDRRLRMNEIVEGMAELLGVRDTVQRQSWVWC